MTKRHSWSEKHRPDEHTTKQACWDCGLEKVTRHEPYPPWHWVEWWRGGKRIQSKRTPACEPVGQVAA